MFLISDLNNYLFLRSIAQESATALVGGNTESRSSDV